MRISVTIDSDVEEVIRARMAEASVSFGRALNDLIRESGALGRVDEGFTTRTFDLGPPRIDLTKANQIAGELEDEAVLEKMRRGR